MMVVIISIAIGILFGACFHAHNESVRREIERQQRAELAELKLIEMKGLTNENFKPF